ncbi:MAG: urease accessory protein UreD [Hyphomicrobiaceae bacterium]|nr:urease accessory protein UreD [Hyphomicrobiaceae bacterium]
MLHVLPPESGSPPKAATIQRAIGIADVGFRDDAGVTRLQRLYQEGQAKVRLPKLHGEPPVAVLLNTAGGITGGDRFSYTVSWGAATWATATTQAAERVYRRSHGVGTVVNRLVVEAGARAEWLPQETILFDACGLDRSLEIELAEDASLIAVESLVFGRTASGERVEQATITDRWRIRRGGRLILADTLRFDGPVARVLDGKATGDGAVATATLVLAGPAWGEPIERVRELIADCGCEAGVSAWNGLTVARLLGRDAAMLRAALVRVVEALRGRAMPRVWSC